MGTSKVDGVARKRLTDPGADYQRRLVHSLASWRPGREHARGESGESGEEKADDCNSEGHCTKIGSYMHVRSNGGSNREDV